MPLFAKVVDGHVESYSFCDQPADPPAGYIEVPVDIDREDVRDRAVVGDPMNGGSFGSKRAQSQRAIARGTFMDRFTIQEQIALEAIAEGQNASGRMVRVFTRRLEAEEIVRLDSPVLAASLAQLSQVLVGAGVTGWEDEQAAAARVTQILA